MIKSKLLSVFELSLFMVDGFNRFTGDIKSFYLSFLVAAITLPFVALSVPYLRTKNDILMNVTIFEGQLLLILKHVVGVSLILLFTYYMCKLLKKKDRFVKLVTVSNWLTLSPLVLYIPFLILMMNGVYMYQEVYPFLVVISLYSYVLAAFVIRYVVDIPWEFAAFLAICTMAINETLYEVYYDIVNYL